MNKVSAEVSNNFCPQTLFLYGTYKEDGTANFGLFCWLSYYWDNGMCVMASVGGEKLTKDRIRTTGVFSANLVTESILPIADYLGNIRGYDAQKMIIDPATEKGRVLDVPVLSESPVCFELEVDKTVKLEGSDVFLCKVRNVLADEALFTEGKSIEELMRYVAPVRTTCATYFAWDGKFAGGWGEPMKLIKKD